MARQIDERIVQMTFNNQEFEQRAKATISTLGNLKKAVDFTGLTNGFAELGNSVNKMNFTPLLNSISSIGNQFSVWEQLAIGALRRIGDQAAQTGERLIRSLTIEQLGQGWNKYEQRTSSVQTLVNSTGMTVQEIEKYLDRLMKFSDETSYGFTDMTKALATMTASGGDINKLIPMITGIANAVAYAGKGATEFSRVMYNLNQSYGQGYLSLMDWKSVENAGASSKALKEVLIQTAEEIGTIKKGTVTIGNFTEKLKTKAFTSEVMEKAFTKFSQLSEAAMNAVDAGEYETVSQAIEALAGNYDELAVRAFKSAQEAKSFKDVIDATKDAVSSGWMQTFALIFGNYDEAKKLWTDIVNEMWEWFAAPATERNNLLKSWHDGLSEFQKSIESGDIETIADKIETYKETIASLYDNDYLQKSSNQNSAILSVSSAMFTRDTEKIGNAISEVYDKYKDLDIITSIFNNKYGDESKEILSLLVERKKKLDELGDSEEDEAKRLEIIADYNKKIGDIAKSTLTFLNARTVFSKENLDNTQKQLDAELQLANLLKAETKDREAIGDFISKNSDYLKEENFGEYGDGVLSLLDKLKELEKQPGKNAEAIKSLKEQIADLVSLSSNLDTASGLERTKKLVTDFYQAVSDKDAAKVTELWSTGWKEISDAIGGAPKKIQDLQNEIDKLESTDAFSKQVKDWQKELETASRSQKTLLQSNISFIEGLNDAIKNDTIADYFKNNQKAMSDFFKDNEKYKKILTEINRISNDSTLSSEQKQWYLANEYDQVSELIKEYSQLDDAEEKRNELAKELNDYFIEGKSGYDIFIDTIHNVIYGITDTLNTVKEAWKEVFPSTTGTGLIDLTQKFSDFVNKLILSEDQLASFKELLRNIFSILTIATSTLSSMWNNLIVPLGDFLEPILESIYKYIKDISDKIYEATGNFTKNMSPIDSFFKSIFNIITTLFNSFIKPLGSMLLPILEDIFVIIKDIGAILFDTVNDTVSNFSPLQSILSSILDILSPIVKAIGNIVKGIRELLDQSLNNQLTDTSENLNIFSRLLSGIGKIFQFIASVFKGTINVFEGLGKVLGIVIDKIKGVAGEFLSSHGTDVAAIAEGGFIGALALALFNIVGKINKIKIDDIFGSIVNLFTSGKIFTKIKETFDSISEAINKFTQSIEITKFKVISDSILKLAAALLVISLVDSDKIVGSLAAIAGVLLEVIGVMSILNSMKIGDINASVKSLSKIASSILMLSFAFKIFASINLEQLGIALIGLGGSLAIVLAFIALLGKSTKGLEDAKLSKIGTTLKSIGLGLIEIAIALKIAASVNPDQLGTALLGLGGALGAVFLFMLGLSKIGDNSMASGMLGSKAIMAIGVALIELAVALKIMSTISFEEMSVALLGILGSLGMLFAFMAGIGEFVGAGNFAIMSVSMIALSGALILMAGAFRILSKLTLGQIGKGILAIAGGLGSLALIAIPLGVLSPVMLLAAAAIGLFGKALLTVSEGIVAFASTYMLLQTIGDDISGSLLNILTQFSAAVIQIIPGLFLGLGQAILNFGDELVSLGLQLIEIIVRVMLEGVPRIAETSLQLVITILTLLRDNIGQITALGGDIIIAFLQGVRDKLPEVVTVIFEILAGVVTAIGEGIPYLVDALIVAVTNIINGVAESIRSNAGEIGAAIGNFWSALIEAIITGFGSGVATFGENLLDFGTGIWGGIKQLFGGEQSNEEANEVGKDLVTNVDTGLKENREVVYKSATETGKETAKKMDAKVEATTSGKSTLTGLYNGLMDKDLLDQIKEAGRVAARYYNEGYEEEQDQHSPSRRMMRSGIYTVMGLVKGLTDVTQTNQVRAAGADLANAVADAVFMASEMADDVLSNGLNPIISPVLDMSNIQSGANAISSMLDTGASYNAALAVSNANARGLGIQNGGNVNPTFNIDFTVNNAGRDLTDSDIERYGRRIADIVNQQLGGMIG